MGGVIYNAIFKNDSFMVNFAYRVAYFCDYQEMDKYPNLNKNERIILHDNGIISVATIDENNKITISIRNFDN